MDYDSRGLSQAALERSEPLFVAAHPRLRDLTVARVLAGLRTEESAWLQKHPAELGLRCEALLAGETPEWLESNGFVDDAMLAALKAAVPAAL